MKTIKIAVTLGDPAGIGAEVTFKALSAFSSHNIPPIEFIIVGDKRLYGRKLQSNVFFCDVPSPIKKLQLGKPSAECGRASYEFIKKAVSMAVSSEVDAIVTAPISKISIRIAGINFGGHTEILGFLTGAKYPQMLMVACHMRALLLSHHLPMKAVPSAVSKKKIMNAVGLIARYFGKKIRIAVCSLNPHAGDAGSIGVEEIKMIAPAVRKLQKKKIDIYGPIPADVAFMKMFAKEYDFCISMYHDQTMIPMKLSFPDKIVNVTLGIPFLRTSPGHGVAYDIAGKNKANPSCMIEAIKFAAINHKLWRNLK